MKTERTLFLIQQAKNRRSKKLDLSDLNLSIIPNEIVELTELKTIDLSKNKISDINILKHLPNLQTIILNNNNISDITGLLPFLSRTNNSIKLSLNDKQQSNRILIYNNPIVTPPLELVKQGNSAVVKYLLELVSEQKHELNEAKIILVGEGGAGKTSIMKRLISNSFNLQESQTHGITVNYQTKSINGKSIKLRYWDFGGQDIMHATHQFFLTRRSIYLLVLDSRKDEKAEYWLKHIQNFGGSSPTIIVINKTDENSVFDLNRKHLLQKYPFIKTFHKVSCKSNDSISILEKSLNNEIWDLELRKTFLPDNWFKVKTYFETMGDDFVSNSVYKSVCVEQGVDDEKSQITLLRYLHDLGIVFYFEKLKKHDTQVLNPLWLTNAVYRIINSPIAKKNNGFYENDLEEIINDSFFNKHPIDLDYIDQETDYKYDGKYAFIADIMREFEICYLAHSANKYIIPELLPVNQNEYNLSESNKKLFFVIEYPDFLPNSIISRLMVRLHEKIFNGMMWKTGFVIFENEPFEAVANIIADKESKTINITIGGNENRLMLRFIRNEISKINATFSNLNCIEWVLLKQNFQGEKVDYNHLIALEKRGKTHYQGFDHDYPIKELLDGIDLKMKRIFISYSKKDNRHKETLKNHLTFLSRLSVATIWNDRDMSAGEDWDKEIKNHLYSSDIVLLLVSANSISTDYIWNNELPLIRKRTEEGKCIFIPIILDYCEWNSLDFAKFNALPEKGKPLRSYNPRSKGYLQIAEGIKNLILN